VGWYVVWLRRVGLGGIGFARKVHAARGLQMFRGPYWFHSNSVASIFESLVRARTSLTPGSMGVDNSLPAFKSSRLSTRDLNDQLVAMT
jgi:hypothetical protein